MPSLFMTAIVCAAIATNEYEYDCVSGEYLAISLFVAASAAAPGVCDDNGRYVVHSMIGVHAIVTSHCIKATPIVCSEQRRKPRMATAL